jgi:hypothetical protein
MSNLKYYRKRNLVCKTQKTVFSFTAILKSSDVHQVVFAPTCEPATKHEQTVLL